MSSHSAGRAIPEVVGGHLAGHADILQGALPVVNDVNPGGGGELGGPASLLPHWRCLRQLRILCGENKAFGFVKWLQPRFDAAQKETGSGAAPAAASPLIGERQSGLDRAFSLLKQLSRENAQKGPGRGYLRQLYISKVSEKAKTAIEKSQPSEMEAAQ